MKLWAVARMIEEPGQEGSTIPAVGLYSNNYSSWSADGFAWTLCYFSVANTTAVSADNRIKLLPQATLDSAWSSLPANVRNNVKTEVESIGLVWNVNNNWTVRQVLQYLSNQIQPGADPTAFDIRDTEA
jgi:hypothetical protein